MSNNNVNREAKFHHFGSAPPHPLKGVVLSGYWKHLFSYRNRGSKLAPMTQAEETVFGQLIAAHEAEIYRPEPEPRHSLTAVTREARLPVHKAALRTYEHMLLMDHLGDTVQNVATSQLCVKRHVEHIFDILKQRDFMEPAESKDMWRLTPKGRANCGHVIDAKERERDERYLRDKHKLGPKT